MSDNGRYVTTSLFCPTDTTQSSYVSLICSSYRQRYSKELEDFNLFDVRLQTFVFYPKSSISSRDMASAGFYYASEDQVLKCSSCKSTVTRFRKGDDPFVTGHHSGCPFVALCVTKKTEKPVLAAVATVEHSLSPLGESLIIL